MGKIYSFKNIKSLMLSMPLIVLGIAGCQSVTESEVAKTQKSGYVNLMKIAAEAEEAALNNKQFLGRAVYLRGEMNDYSIQRPYRLRQFTEHSFCTVAPLRADWSPYRFKFADESWQEGTNFGYAIPPGILKEGSAPLELNPNSLFEEIRYEVEADGIYRFCIVYKGDTPYAEVTRLENSKLTTMDEIIKQEIADEFSTPQSN